LGLSAQKDKNSVIQVIGCIFKEPTILLDDKYNFIEKDFPEKFHKIIFGAMEHLVKKGVQELTYINVDNFLSNYPKQYKIFTDNNGMDYLVNCIENANVGNFEYYFNKLKKFSLLNQLIDKGFETSQIYDPSICDYDEVAEMQVKFDNYTLEDIFNIYKNSISQLEEAYSPGAAHSGIQAGYKMKDLKNGYKETPEMGMPMNSQKLTTIFRGRRLKKFYLRTLPVGTGKTRQSIADACCVSIPMIWNYDKGWVRTNCQEPTLYVTTELESTEIQSIIIAYVSGVSEDLILDGKYKNDEEERVDKAIEIINASPLYIEYLPSFNIDIVENTVRNYKVKHNISHFFFDYIFTSVRILSEIATKTKGIKLREDNVLLMFSDKMKELANTLNIHVDTSTQANGDWRNNPDAGSSLIASSKAIANKIDCGYVALPLLTKDKESIKSIMQHGFYKEPNLVYHIYKVRRGKINNVKLFVYFDYGTCRTYDQFVTTSENHLLNVEDTDIEIILEQTEDLLNDKENSFYF
jgi:replicative DNA helicase